MATKGERYRALRDFIAASFDRNDFYAFLKLNGYEDIASAVVREAADSGYFLDVVETMDQRGLIDAAFFELLKVQRPRKTAEIEGLERAWLFEGRPRPTEDRKWATYSPVTSLRTLLGKHWKLLLTVLAGVPTLLVLLSLLGLPVSNWTGITANQTSQVVVFGIGLVVLVVIRIPKVDSTVTLWLVPPPPLLPDQPRIFRGPLPYAAEDADRFYGRTADIETCWDRIRRKPFFILEGESGCGKSSLLSTALLPRARGGFHVVECRCAEDPFGKLRSAILGERYQRSSRAGEPKLAEALEAFHQARGDGSNTNLLVCIDQFEEFFVTVKDTVRGLFFEALRDAIDRGQFRLVLGIRSDFSDLLWGACREVDPDHRAFAFDRESYYTLRSFEAGSAESVLDRMFDRPDLHEGGPVLREQLRDFSRALVRNLLRPPLDQRLCKEDEERVVPVELQMVGWTYETILGGKFSAADLRRRGGKAGLYRTYLEDAKDYVFRKTGVPGSTSLLILRRLISPSGTKWPQSVDALTTPNLHLPVERVAEVLGAFSERFLVRPLPGEDGGNGKLGVGSRRYELMHEHFVQLLAEAPEPENQRARDAEERLRFWKQRAHRLLS